MRTLKSIELEYKKRQAVDTLSKIENASRYYDDNKQEILGELGKCFNDPIARVFKFPSYAEYNKAGNKVPDYYALNVIRKSKEVKGYELVANKSRTIYGEEVLIGTVRKAPRNHFVEFLINLLKSIGLIAVLFCCALLMGGLLEWLV